MSGRYGNYSRSPSPYGRRERERFQTQDNFGRCVNLHKRSLPTLRETPLSPAAMMWSLCVCWGLPAGAQGGSRGAVAGVGV